MDDKTLAILMCELGYRVHERDVFVYEKGSLVEHYLYFVRSRERREILSADFGVLHRASHEFSKEMLLKYGGLFYAEMSDRIIATQCFMRFSLWRFSKMLPPRYWDLSLPDIEKDVRRRLESTVLELASRIQSSNAFLALLADDSEPCPWFAANSAARVAQLIFLSAEVGRGDECGARILEDQNKKLLIQNNLSPEEDAESFVKHAENELAKRR